VSRAGCCLARDEKSNDMSESMTQPPSYVD
jgi:hypothetical protein